ncbi:hypothetical protein [Nocardia sp. SYP-A9097]|uniref:hypothetical protein n=1 Tax=Nocardia sp. SYP-A9097 TaxID=2663237 RepID=UPI001E61D26C|nr:hypothetical protein [Nocardia sp. SYP-A9097]
MDALDEGAVRSHLESVVERAGRVDISFNAVGIPDTPIVGIPLIDLDAANSPCRSPLTPRPIF